MPRLLPGDDVTDPDRDGGIGDLPLDGLLEAEQLVEARRREEAAEVDLAVPTTDAVDPAVALHQSHGVPGQVVVDDAARPAGG